MKLYQQGKQTVNGPKSYRPTKIDLCVVPAPFTRQPCFSCQLPTHNGPEVPYCKLSAAALPGIFCTARPHEFIPTHHHTHQRHLRAHCMQKMLKARMLLLVAALICLAGRGQPARDLRGTCAPQTSRDSHEDDIKCILPLNDVPFRLCDSSVTFSGGLHIVVNSDYRTTMKSGCGVSHIQLYHGFTWTCQYTRYAVSGDAG